MGRIADALKKAEEERRQRLSQGGSSESVAVLEPPENLVEVPGPAVTDYDSSDAPHEPLALDQSIHELVVPYYDRSSVVAEQYRSLRTRLLTLNPQNDHRVLAVTSAIPREGKSVTTANLGMILSEIRHFKVLCVDVDFRRSRLGHLFGCHGKKGMANMLRGEADFDEVIQPTPIPNLYFVAAGETSGSNAADLLASMRTTAIFRRFQSEFHYTLVDTPPATTVTDVGIIGQVCSGVILLVRLNFTPEPMARRALRLLKVNNIPVIGCVLIGHEDRAGYGYGYGSNYYYYRYYGSRESDRR